MIGRKHIILACLLATCFASERSISQYLDADDTQGPVCYNCHILSDPGTCTDKIRCGRDEICMLHELMPGVDGSKRYTAHCETELVCQNLRNHAKRAYVFCHNCCNQDLCNNHCGSTPTHPPITHRITTRPTTSRPTTSRPTTSRPTTTTAAATAVALTSTTTTKATNHIVYPIMCYSCQNMVDPNLCKHLVTCPQGFGCMIQQVGQDADFQTLYTSSCEPDWLCKRMPHSADELIDKRAESSHLEMNPEVERRSSTCDKCCHQHLCNGHCSASSNHLSATPATHSPTTRKTTHIITHRTTHTTTHKTTHKPTTHIQMTTNGFSATPLHVKTRGTTIAHAPLTTTAHYKHAECIKNNFTSIPYINLCFKLETVALKWSVAERWCGFYGATLAVLDDPGKFSVIETVLRYEPHFHNEVVYTGGHDEFNNGTFYWPNQKRVLIDSWSSLNFQQTAGKCIGLDGTNGFKMAFTDCDRYRKFICSIDTS